MALPVLVVLSIAVLVVAAAGVATYGSAAIERPTYAAGDRWVFRLYGSLDAFPGLNASDAGTFSLTVTGRVEVVVRGIATRNITGTLAGGVEVATHTTGFLNGTFEIPGGPLPLPVSVSGGFTSDSVEFWEGTDYFPVAVNEETSYSADVTYLVPIHFDASFRTDATTLVVSEPLFPMDVGQRANATLVTEVRVNATVSAPGLSTTWENRTTVASNWTREVLARGTVAVDAGTFDAYRVNQSLGSVPGLAGLPPSAGGNETAFFSNDVGFYVKRAVYANGTPVAEMSLRSYTRASGSFPWAWVLGGILLVAAAIPAVLILRRRRMSAIGRPPGSEEGKGAR